MAVADQSDSPREAGWTGSCLRNQTVELVSVAVIGFLRRTILIEVTTRNINRCAGSGLHVQQRRFIQKGEGTSVGRSVRGIARSRLPYVGSGQRQSSSATIAGEAWVETIMIGSCRS